MQLDYGSILQGGMGLVPNLRDQLIQDALLEQRNTVFRQQQEDRAAQIRAAQEAKAKEAEFQAALDEAMMSGDPRAIQRLRFKFPEFTKGMKDAFDALDEDVRRTNLTQIGSIYANLNSGNTDRATQLLRQRIEADRAAGQADPQDEAILAELESGDPMRVNAAKATVGIMLAAIEPDKFGETYGKLNPTEATPATIREYEARVAKFGKAAADAWLATEDAKLIPVQPGGSVFQLGGDTVPMGGGFGGGIVATPGQMAETERLRRMFPNAPEFGPEYSEGGDPSGSGVGLTVDQFRANAEVLGPERAAAMTARNGIPVRVRSVQEANALPPGTLYVTPTGERYTR